MYEGLKSNNLQMNLQFFFTGAKPKLAQMAGVKYYLILKSNQISITKTNCDV
jgi:hypothetical protein